MKHPSIRQLFDYWNERRGRRCVPERSDIDPGAIRHLLADSFILGFDPRAGHPFRVAGTRVCALFGRELNARPFLDLCAKGTRKQLADVLAIVTEEKLGVVAAATAETGRGEALRLELLLLPLGCHGRTDARVLGALAAGELPDSFGNDALREFTLETHRFLRPECLLDGRHGPPLEPVPLSPPSLRRACLLSAAFRLSPSEIGEGCLRHGFLVYDGGQSRD
jgi:hypothetical protein